MSFNQQGYNMIADSNNVIYHNLTKVYEELFLIKNSYNLDEDDEYEEFYNRISFYFSNILAQLKLKYIESIKLLEQKNAQNEKDILNLIMENMLLKIENEHLEEKNMLNISNYIEIQANSEKLNSFDKEEHEMIKKRSRNQSSNIVIDKDFSFQNEVKNNINTKIKKKINLYNNTVTSYNAFPFNTNTNNTKYLSKKKSNLSNFISYSKIISNNNKTAINHGQNTYSIQYNSNTRNENNLKSYHLRSNTEDSFKNHERSMYNLLIKSNNYFKEPNSISNSNNRKSRNISCPKGNTKIISVNISANKSTNNLLNGFNKKNNKYQRNLLNKINSIHNMNMKGIINMKMKNNK